MKGGEREEGKDVRRKKGRGKTKGTRKVKREEGRKEDVDVVAHW